MEFTTKISDTPKIDIYGLDKHLGIEVDDYSALAVIKWSAEVETRDWGIKGVCAIVRSVSGSIEYSYYADDDLECTTLIEKEIEFVGDGFEIKDEDFKFKNGMLEPIDIEIDFEKKKITIT